MLTAKPLIICGFVVIIPLLGTPTGAPKKSVTVKLSVGPPPPALIDIWPVPAGHKSRILLEKPEKQIKVGVIDLISAGLVSAGQTLYPNQNKHAGKVAQILDDGRIQCENIIFDSLSMAGIQIRKRSTNGWTFWLVDEKTKVSMADLREEYRELIGLEDGEDEIEDSDGSDD